MNILACVCGGSLELAAILLATGISSIVVALEWFGLNIKKKKIKGTPDESGQ